MDTPPSAVAPSPRTVQSSIGFPPVANRLRRVDLETDEVRFELEDHDHHRRDARCS